MSDLPIQIVSNSPAGESPAFQYVNNANSNPVYYNATFEGNLKLKSTLTLQDIAILQAACKAVDALLPGISCISDQINIVLKNIIDIQTTTLLDLTMTIRMTQSGIIPISGNSKNHEVTLSNNTQTILNTSPPAAQIVTSVNYINSFHNAGIVKISPYIIPFILKTPPEPIFADNFSENVDTSSSTPMKNLKPKKTPVYTNIYASNNNENGTAFSMNGDEINDIPNSSTNPTNTTSGVVTFTQNGEWAYFQVSNPSGTMVFNITMVGGGGASWPSSNDPQCGTGGGGGGECLNFSTIIPTGSYYIYVGSGAKYHDHIVDPITGSSSYHGGNTYFAYINGNNTKTPIFTAKGGYSKGSNSTGGGYGYSSSGNLETSAYKGYSYGGKGGVTGGSGSPGGSGGVSNFSELQIKSQSTELNVNIYAGGGGGGGSYSVNGQTNNNSKYGSGGAGSGGNGGGYPNSTNGYNGKTSVNYTGGDGEPYTTDIYGGGGGGGAAFDYYTDPFTDNVTHHPGAGSRGMVVITWGDDLTYTNKGASYIPPVISTTIPKQSSLSFIPWNYTGELNVEITELLIPDFIQSIIQELPDCLAYPTVLNAIRDYIPKDLANLLADIRTTQSLLTTTQGGINLLNGNMYTDKTLPCLAYIFGYDRSASEYYVNNMVNYEYSFSTKNANNIHSVSVDEDDIKINILFYYNPLEFILNSNSSVTLRQILEPAPGDTWLQMILNSETIATDAENPETYALGVWNATGSVNCVLNLKSMFPFVPM